ncbi:BatD family protein [Solidesulfovibrio sp.]|uniref:BatD family protein n=1 Tax=Solidesulfovibrio sp. TaxID=2910990 RepID=UPI00261125EE|nr:BatD family protein [Solidesulfovibrio sp.]
MRRLSAFALALAVLVPALARAGEPRAAAVVEPAEGVAGRGLTLRVTITGNDAAVIDVPDMPDWTVIPRGRSVGVRGEDGEPVAAYRFEIVPRRSGTLSVPALTVETGGARLTTSPLTVAVRPSPAPPRALAGRDVFLDAAVSRDAPYVGEAFVYTARLYRAVPAAAVTLEPPAFAGCVVDPLPGQRDGEVRDGGRAYATAEVDYLVTPLRAGSLRLGLPTAKLRGLGKAPGETVVSGPELTVGVRPLPAYAGTVPFTGLVGRMALDARLLADARGEAVYELTLTGRGNLEAAAPPTLAAPPGLAVRSLPTEGEVAPTPQGYEGRRVFRYALAAREAGEFTLPAVRLAVFDPVAGAYGVIEAPARSFAAAPEPPPGPVAPPLGPPPVATALGSLTESWAGRALLALLPPALWALALLPRRRSRPAGEGGRPGPSAVAEALRRALDRATDASREPWPEVRDLLARLDRLLYSGEAADAAALAAARDRGLALLRRLGP